MDVKVEGFDILLGGKLYCLPPIPLVKVAKVARMLHGGNVIQDELYVESLVDAIFWSLERNYPDIVRADVADNLDMVNFKSVLEAFMMINGFVQNEAGEGQAR